jgi:glycosyltransferase involved in cell wall biosynthesis
MKVLHVISSVDPRGGGPIEGVRQRGRRLVEMGHTVEIATLDAPGEPFLASFPLPVHALGPARSSYRYSPRLVPWLRAHAPAFDAVVVNGLWQYHSYGAWLALRRLGLPYHVFTHGMLDPWFKRAYPLKHLKKWLYWPWAEYRVLRDAAGVLFTSEEERLLARESFWLYRAKERVVAYGTSAPPPDADRLSDAFLDTYPQLRGKRIVLFLSRIHEKKGCDLLVEAFGRVAAADPALHLVIAGPDRTGLRQKLERLAERAGVTARTTWPGMLQGDAKWGAFYASEVFALPSHQENFGIAVVEALACGLPVVISNKVNIWREIAADQAGLVHPDTPEGTARALQQWLALSFAERALMRRRALAAFRERFTVEAMANSLLAVLGERSGAPALHRAPTPAG